MQTWGEGKLNHEEHEDHQELAWRSSVVAAVAAALSAAIERVADERRRLVAGLRESGVPFVIREDGRMIAEAVLENILAGSERYRL